jgi:hypothetical protein
MDVPEQHISGIGEAVPTLIYYFPNQLFHLIEHGSKSDSPYSKAITADPDILEAPPYISGNVKGGLQQQAIHTATTTEKKDVLGIPGHRHQAAYSGQYF